MTIAQTNAALQASAAVKTAAERFGILERPDLTFTPEIARETAHLYERVKQFVHVVQALLCACNDIVV